MSEEQVMDIANKAVKQCTSIIKADTVGEMQERLTTFFSNDDNFKYNEVDDVYINEVIDQIAKEMVENG